MTSTATTNDSNNNNKANPFEQFIRDCQDNTNEIDYFYILDHLQNSEIQVKKIETLFKERFDSYEENKKKFNK
jgi:hypothetical protein